MDKETKKVVSMIATIQVEALSQIKANIESVDHDLLRKLLQISDTEISQSLEDHIQLYIDMENNPNIIKLLSEYQLYICSHILWKMESEWINEYSQGILGAWAIITTYTNKFHPEVNLLKF